MPPPVAPLGVAPPPVGPDAPLEPEPLVPLEPVPDVPEVAPDEPDVPEEPVADEAEPDDEEDEAPVVGEEVVVDVVDVVEFVEFVEAGDRAATVAVGTVSGGAPAVSVGGEDPPHAARAAHRAKPASARDLCLGPPISVTTRPRGTT
ncbi:MAG TPA: hypothetical protein VLC49_08825 [Solirubrobacteraceae bacterium]|nr:hypothetical protein [Solirubrobacteraceae bacterium]